MELVSIVMPVKNTSLFLRECLNSILQQSYINWELLAVNDQSTDDSFQILSDFSQKDNRVKVFNNDGYGIIDALKLAYKKSKGEFITRMDSDDVMTSDKLKLMVKDLKTNGKGKIALGLVKYISTHEIGEGYQKYQDWLNALTLKGDNFSEIYKECVIPSPCWMVYREDFERCGAFNSNVYPEDYDLTFRFYQYGLKCLPSDNLLHFWRDYSERTSRNHEHYAYNAFLELKLDYFLKLHYDDTKNLVIWGAGKKGKKVAELLLYSKVEFQWICDNPKKIGKDIYNQKMLPFTALDNIDNTQSIITVASPKAQEEIRAYLTKRSQISMRDYFFFC